MHNQSVIFSVYYSVISKSFHFLLLPYFSLICFVCFEFRKHLPAFSKITVNTCLDLLHPAVLLFLNARYTFSILIPVVRVEVLVFFRSALSQGCKNNSRPFEIADKIVGHWWTSEVYPDVQQWCFRLLLFTVS